MALSANNLGVTYTTASGGNLNALVGIDLTVERGEFVTIIGPSGCGKSTLLHCLGGLLKSTSGTVTIDATEVRAPEPRRAAFVFQDYTLLPWKSVRSNTTIGLEFARRPKAERQAKAEELLSLVGLADFADSYPRELSGGMQQRVAIARAMAMEPDYLLMDEPFGALDEQTRRHLGFEMSRLLSVQGQAVVMVTHSLDEAILWADRVVVMCARPGRIAEIIAVSEPRPRTARYVMSPEFSDIRARLFGLLESFQKQGELSSAVNGTEPPKVSQKSQ